MRRKFGFMSGCYKDRFYIIPTVIFYSADSFYKTIEIAWMRCYIGVCVNMFR